MDSEVKRYNRFIKRYEPELKAHRSKDGIIRVSHFEPTWMPYDVDGETLLAITINPYLVFSMTDTWGAQGRPVEWGLEPLYWKLRELGYEVKDQVMADFDRQRARAEQSKENSRRNLFEDVAYGMRDDLKRTLSDVNTASMDKSLDPRRKYERSIRYGNR